MLANVDLGTVAVQLSPCDVVLSGASDCRVLGYSRRTVVDPFKWHPF